MNRVLILLLFFFMSCGYQPLLMNNKDNFKFQEIILTGDSEIGDIISSALSLKEIKTNNLLNKLRLNSKKETYDTSKDSKGKVSSYRTTITVSLSILNGKDKIIKEKTISKNFLFNVKDNKFKLKNYRAEIEKNLINKIIEEIITYTNL